MNKGIIVCSVFIFILAVIVIVLASLYGVKYNCDDDDKPFEPTMVHYPNIKATTLVKLLDPQGSNSFMKPIAYSTVAGKEMTGGLFQLNAGPPLDYTHWYEGIMYFLSGGFKITTANQTFTAVKGDSIYIPRGTKVTYESTTAISLLYYVAQPPGPEKCAEIQAAIDSYPLIVRANNSAAIVTAGIDLFVNKYKSESFLVDLLVSNITGKEITGGLYELLKGPALDYRYEYEEFKYIVEGEFHLTDGAGKFVKAVGGDLMYFPTNTWVHFTSPKRALGFYVGQRTGGTA